MSADTVDGTRSVITGRKVLLGMIAFFGLIIAVNGVFVYFALDSWPGLSEENSYVKGLAYNEQLAAAESQRAAGWQSSLSHTNNDTETLLAATFTDAAGAPLGGLDVRAAARRPIGAEAPLEVELTEVGPGTYHGTLAALDPGRWQVELTAGDAYRLRYEIEVAP